MKTHQFSLGPVYASVEVLTEESDVVWENADMEGQWWIGDFWSKSLRSGKAKELMYQIFDAARSHGIRYIGLHPWARDGIDQENLVKFYESVGFEDCYYAFVKSL